MALVAALPMYDWPEVRSKTDRVWLDIARKMQRRGIPAPDRLARCNGDLPPVAGGIRDSEGRVVAPDPASLPAEEFDLLTLWRHPALVFSQCCWGPMEFHKLDEFVSVVDQPDYSDYPGGIGKNYRSAIVARRDDVPPFIEADFVPDRTDDAAFLPPVDFMRRCRFVYNEPVSNSGFLALRDDMAANDMLQADGSLQSFFAETAQSGSHRESIRRVAGGAGDLAAIDCRSWAMALEHETSAQSLAVVGWTAPRLGLPYICARAVAALM